MYKLTLILKYLRKRRIAWVSLIAVTLCTAMVLVVISVMGGWLRMFRESFHGLSGDILIRAQQPAGFGHYQEMVRRIEALEEVGSGRAVPVIKTFGLINIANRKADGVQVLGIPIDKIGNVNEFPRSLWRQYNESLEAGNQAEAEQRAAHPSFDLLPDMDYQQAYLRTFPNAKPQLVEAATRWPGLIAGIGVVEVRRGEDGKMHGRGEHLYRLPVKLTVLGISPGNFSLDLGNKAERSYWIVDDSHTKVWQYDANTVYVPFDILQKDLGMDEQPVTLADGRRATEPARTSEIHVRVKPGVNLLAARDRIEEVVRQVQQEQGLALIDPPDPIVQTWEQSQAMWLGAIEKEKILVTFLFAMISVVAVFLIFCIFYMIVVEKTRDIGIIKSVGATSSGVAGIFLGYGAAIGIVGGGLGLLFGFLIIHNINYLHTKLGELMGVQIWNPEVYAFDTIPNTMDPKEVAVIVGVAILSSVAGSLVPALRAARMNPVEALRWE